MKMYKIITPTYICLLGVLAFITQNEIKFQNYNEFLVT